VKRESHESGPESNLGKGTLPSVFGVSYKDSNPITLGPSLMSSFNLIIPFEVPSLNPTLRVRT
jgi:hypothetical protein